MNYIRVKVKLIILLSLALIIVPILLVSNQRETEIPFDKKNTIEIITPQPPSVSSVYYKDTTGPARDIYVSGDYAYVAVDYAGLAIIDISDPTNPGTPVYEDTTGSALGVYVSGDYAYVAVNYEGLAVINISDPTNPGTPVYEDTTGAAYDVYVSGDYAYVADHTSGLAVINISDPTNPGTPIYENTTSSARGVYVSGDYAYVADWSSGLAIINISDPTNPGSPVYGNTVGSAYDVYVSGDYAYVADHTSGLAVIDISDPTNPGTPIYEDTTGYARSIYVSGDYAYVADGESGLAVINISNPTNPGTPIYEDTTDSARGVYVSGDYAYVADEDSGLAVIQVRRRYDIVDPILTILYPNSNNNLFGKTAPNFSVIIEDTYPGIDTMWYTIDGGITNTTFTTNESINQLLWESRGNGTVTIRFYANDTSGNINWEEMIVRKDILGPIITINAPLFNQEFRVNPAYDISILEWNLDKIWYTLDGSITNVTITSLSGAIDGSIWEGISEGAVTIRFYANDTIGNISWKDVTIIKIIPSGAPLDIWYFIIIGVIILSITAAISLVIVRKGIKGRGIRVFISHALKDFDKYQIADLVKYLESQKGISKVHYCEADMVGDIDDWMDKTVPRSQLIIFFSTKNSIDSKDCIKELRLGFKHNIQIMPILGENMKWEDLEMQWEDLELDISRQFGKEFNSEDFGRFREELYDYVIKVKSDLEEEIRGKKRPSKAKKLK